MKLSLEFVLMVTTVGTQWNILVFKKGNISLGVRLLIYYSQDAYFVIATSTDDSIAKHMSYE